MNNNMQRGQSTLEYVLLVIIVVGALLTMQVYIKRSIAGGWRRGADDLGEHYEPKATNESSNYSISSSIISNTFLSGSLSECQRDGCYVNRVDTINTYETTNTTRNLAGY